MGKLVSRVEAAESFRGVEVCVQAYLYPEKETPRERSGFWVYLPEVRGKPYEPPVLVSDGTPEAEARARMAAEDPESLKNRVERAGWSLYLDATLCVLSPEPGDPRHAQERYYLPPGQARALTPHWVPEKWMPLFLVTVRRAGRMAERELLRRREEEAGK